MITVLIADDHAVVREGIKRMLGDTPDIQVAAEAENGREVMEKLKANRVDIAILDVSMPETNVVELLQEIKERYPKLPVLILSMLPEDQYGIRMLKVGANGYLNKASAADQLISAIRKVAAGGRYVSTELAEKLAFELGSGDARQLHELLSDREYQVLCLIGAGKQIKEIADELSLNVRTVSTYRNRILIKMGMNNNAELMRYVIRNQLIPY